jgi:hypothetical protein
MNGAEMMRYEEPAGARMARHPIPAASAHQCVLGGRHRALITAYSALGLILDRAPGLELGERVTVELRSGDRLPTRVVWVRRAKARVRFLGSIAQGHPVPQLLEEAAIRHQSQHTSPAAR